ncbi:hypothetical protein C7B62_00070 [Pleurocapsa sp. CCALA 161]|nr:hypothetical protein C7B62_00070 [Pleurocapsa sp. CCALA 161]
MRGNEFVKKVKKLAKVNGLESRVDRKRSKGSHVTLYYGDKLKIVRNLKDELKLTLSVLGKKAVLYLV